MFSARQYSKFFKKLQNFFCFNFRATPWSNNISSTNQKTLKEQAGDLFYFVCLLLLAWPLFLYVLKACVPKILHLFTCRPRNCRVDVSVTLFLVESRPSKHPKPNDCSAPLRLVVELRPAVFVQKYSIIYRKMPKNRHNHVKLFKNQKL